LEKSTSAGRSARDATAAAVVKSTGAAKAGALATRSKQKPANRIIK
jgi:hypothetical protein